MDAVLSLALVVAGIVCASGWLVFGNPSPAVILATIAGMVVVAIGSE